MKIPTGCTVLKILTTFKDNDHQEVHSNYYMHILINIAWHCKNIYCMDQPTTSRQVANIPHNTLYIYIYILKTHTIKQGRK